MATRAATFSNAAAAAAVSPAAARRSAMCHSASTCAPALALESFTSGTASLTFSNAAIAAGTSPRRFRAKPRLYRASTQSASSASALSKHAVAAASDFSSPRFKSTHPLFTSARASYLSCATAASAKDAAFSASPSCRYRNAKLAAAPRAPPGRPRFRKP